MTESAPTHPPADRLQGFRSLYLGIVAYVVLSLSAVYWTESLLQRVFERRLRAAVTVSPADGSVVEQIQQRVHASIQESAWLRIGGLRATPLVIGADGQTPIYLSGSTLAPPPPLDPENPFREADRLLPAIATIQVMLPGDSLLAGAIWAAFGGLTMPLLYRRYRRLAQREEARLREAIQARDVAAERARSIQVELERLRHRLAQIEPLEQAHSVEIVKLEDERSQLRMTLHELEERERKLRERVGQVRSIEEERRALEELLEEALRDLERKEGEIHGLQENLSRNAPAARSTRPRLAEQLARRLRTLYPRLEIDDRAIRDLVALGDDSERLRAEEALKRLEQDVESAGSRRKVGGLPQHLAIFELGFAGKGRIYYARGQQRAIRILAVGGKASQKTDIEYLSRLSLD